VYRGVSQEVRLSQLRTDFVSAVSHEFRSPLSSILALSERLESSRVRDPAKLAQYHQVIGQEARRLSALVTRLLEFAQIEEGKKVYSFERVELVGIACEALQSCHYPVRQERIRLCGEDAAPLWVRADRIALRHCIQNLIENAVKYSPSDSPIAVTCASASGSNVVEVHDRGIGIPLAEQGRIFEKFYRGRQASELDVQGVGIGLALVRHVMERHGGSVSVQSQPGQGSRFRLHLPRAEG
jgi:two-component system phosphate regulon sensor histidine kinase PhoR